MVSVDFGVDAGRLDVCGLDAGDAVGNTTGSEPLVQPVRTTATNSVAPAQLLIPHSHPLRFRHDRDLPARP